MKKLFILLAAVLTFITTAFAQIGSATADLVFTPVTPCRLFDTRTTSGGTGPIVGGAAKNFVVWGATSFAAQGGAATNCGIVAGANTASIAVNMTVVLPPTAGFITAYPTGVTRPNAAALNFNAGDIRGNMVIVNVAQTGATNLSVYSTSTTDLVGDVVGFYSKPVATALDCTAVSDGNTTVPASVALQSVTAPFCDAGYSKTATSCSFFGTQLVVRRTETSSLDVTGATSSCTYDNPAPTAQNVFITSTCCRIPGR